MMPRPYCLRRCCDMLQSLYWSDAFTYDAWEKLLRSLG